MLWSINSTPNKTTGYMPFFMVYGAEAVLPSDIRHDSPRVAAYVEADNEKAHRDSLDLLDEERDLAAARSAIYQQDLRRYHSRRLRPELFKRAIWCSGSSRIRLICTSYPHLGKDLMWSAKICTMDHTTLSMFETIRTHTRQRRRPASHGILLIFGLITPEPPALVMYILVLLYIL